MVWELAVKGEEVVRLGAETPKSLQGTRLSSEMS